VDGVNVRSLLRRYLVLVGVCALLGGMVGAYLELRQPPGYVATIRVFAYSGQGDRIPVSQTTTLAIQKMDTYGRLVSSTRLSQRIVERLNLPVSPRALASNTSAALDKDTVVMTVKVRASSKEDARAAADVLPDELTRLVNQLSDVSVSDPVATIFTTIDGPDVVKSTSMRRLALSVVLGLVIGAAVGLAAAAVRDRSRGPRSPEALSAMVGAPVLGIIPGARLRWNGAVGRDRAAPSSMRGLPRRTWARASSVLRPGVSSGRLTGARPEVEQPTSWLAGLDESQRLAFHRLARNLAALSDRTERLVMVCAATQGTGATTVATGLAAAIAERGQRAVLVDAQFTVPGVAATLSLAEGSAPRGRGDTARPACVSGVTGLDVISLHVDDPGALTVEGRRAIHSELAKLRHDYDVVVVDTAPVLARSDLPSLVDAADAVLLVVNQMASSSGDVAAAVEVLRAVGASNFGMVVNKADPKTLNQALLLSGIVDASHPAVRSS
jgi:polysaccharide biosynthesis transport protein